jgi:hypothetical protein
MINVAGYNVKEKEVSGSSAIIIPMNCIFRFRVAPKLLALGTVYLG